MHLVITLVAAVPTLTTLAAAVVIVTHIFAIKYQQQQQTYI